jgi:DNA primase
MAKAGAQFRTPCPSCKTGGPRAVVITPAKNLFYCFSAEKGGDQLAMVAHMRGCAVNEAAEWLGGTSTREGTSTSTSTVLVSKDRAGFPPLDYLDSEHAAVEAAGFNIEEAKVLGIGYAPKGVLRGTVAVPIRDEAGTLLGYIGVTEARCPPKGFINTNVVPLARKTA